MKQLSIRMASPTCLNKMSSNYCRPPSRSFASSSSHFFRRRAGTHPRNFEGKNQEFPDCGQRRFGAGFGIGEDSAVRPVPVDAARASPCQLETGPGERTRYKEPFSRERQETIDRIRGRRQAAGATERRCSGAVNRAF